MEIRQIIKLIAALTILALPARAQLGDKALMVNPVSGGSLGLIQGPTGVTPTQFRAVNGIGDMMLNAAQEVTGVKTFDDLTFALKGSTSGVITINVPAFAGTHKLTISVGADIVMTLPNTSFTVARTDAGQNFGGTQTFLGTVIHSPTARSSGSSAYFTLNTPGDTTLTAATESVGWDVSAQTRQWSTGAIALQREHVIEANTIAFVGASVVTEAVNLDIANPIQGTNATLTNAYALRAASEHITGNLKVDGTITGTITGLSANPSAVIGLTAVNGVAGSLMTSDSAPALSQAITPTWSGVHTFTPAARASGTASYFTVNTPADTGITTATESIGANFATGARTWVDGTVALQRERYFAAPTYNKTTTAATFTDVFNAYFDKPIAGTGVTFTRTHTLGIVDSTSAASSITGGFIVATTIGTTATSVGIGGGNINAGGTITAGGVVTGSGFTGSTTASSFAATTITGGANTTALTVSRTANTIGVLPYIKYTIPADTGQSSNTEAPGIQGVTATRTWGGSGSVGLQREIFFPGPTYAAQTANTITDAFNMYLTPPAVGTNTTITRDHTLGIVDSTSAASSITGGLIVANAIGTTATSVGIGGGNINAGGTLTTGGAIAEGGKTTSYNGVTTAGWGHPAIYGAARATAQTAANATVASCSVGGADGSFIVSANVLVTTSTTHSFTVTCAYTDEGNTARTTTLTFAQLAGTLATTIANAGGAVPYEGVPLHIRCKAGTAITIGTTGTFTAVTYNAEGVIQQIN